MAKTTASPASQGKNPKPAKNETHQCRCLNGTPQQCPGRTEGSFARGHDARMSSRLATAVARDEIKVDLAEKQMREAGGGDLLVGKMRRAAERIREQATRPARAPKATKATATDKAATEKLAKASSQKVTVYHGKKPFNAQVVVDGQGDRVGRHVLAGKNCDHALDV